MYLSDLARAAVLTLPDILTEDSKEREQDMFLFVIKWSKTNNKKWYDSVNNCAVLD